MSVNASQNIGPKHLTVTGLGREIISVFITFLVAVSKFCQKKPKQGGFIVVHASRVYSSLLWEGYGGRNLR